MATAYHFSTPKIVVFWISALVLGMALGLAVTGNESALVALLLVLSQLLLSGFLLQTSRQEPGSGLPPGPPPALH
jgi:hypothetical protein